MPFGPGRPPKYNEATKQISVRLPLKTLATLDRMGLAGRGEAIVALAARYDDEDGQVALHVGPGRCTHRFAKGASGLLRCTLCGEVK